MALAVTCRFQPRGKEAAEERRTICALTDRHRRSFEIQHCGRGDSPAQAHGSAKLSANTLVRSVVAVERSTPNSAAPFRAAVSTMVVALYE